MIERKIVIGLITSTEYLQKIEALWKKDLIESTTASRLAEWCWEHFEIYNEAPGRDIEGIFMQKMKEGLPADLSEEIEEDILPDLSEEYENSDRNITYLVDQTISYFKERQLKALGHTVTGLVDDAKLDEAEKAINDFNPVTFEESPSIDLKDEKTLIKVREAFNCANENLIYYPGAIGKFWNHQLVRGGFVALLATEKRGKTFMMIDMALRACRQNRKVAFFQAGDMTEAQQIRRICIFLAKKSDMEIYVGEMYEPVRDCVLNQLDLCDKDERECTFGVFDEMNKESIKEVCKDDLLIAFEGEKTYKPCYNCRDYHRKNLGVPWIKKVNNGDTPLDENEAIKLWEAFFTKNKRSFKLSSHSNGTLTVKKMQSIVKSWEREDGFIPDVILTDYTDIFDSPNTDFRHKQNEIWKGHRATSQEFDALVISVTQADADAYNQYLLQLKNFSEDKRKYAHVTAMYGLNQDPKGREKAIGLLRINELVVREGEFSVNNQITVLQNLKRGRPFLGSFKGIK